MKEPIAGTNLVRVIEERARATPDRACMRYFRRGEWRQITYHDVYSRARGVLRGLMALGLQRGDRVAILAENSPEWVIADVACILGGYVVVSVYAGLSTDEVGYILHHSDSRLVFAGDSAQARRVVCARSAFPGLEHIVQLDDTRCESEAVMDLESLSNRGVPDSDLEHIAQSAKQLDSVPLTLLYTSGTTGTPKGVVLTHRNIVSVVAASAAAIDDLDKIEIVLRVLPLSHALERICGHFVAFSLGWTSAQVRGLDTIANDFKSIRPHTSALVPRVFEKTYSAIQDRLANASGISRWIFRFALRVGARRVAAVSQRRPVPLFTAALDKLADMLVFNKIRDGFGGRVRFLGSGGAPLAPDICKFFHCVGVPVLEAWGATETSAPATTNTPSDFRFGSVGKPLACVEVTVADDGELLVRGDSVFGGYFKDPVATADAFTEDGFYKTGDIGTIDGDGFVYITDRKKEIIITAAGKNIAPQKLENLLRGSRFISNAMVYCDQHPYVVALIAPNGPALAAKGIDAASPGPDAMALIQAEVDEANSHLGRFEQIKKFRLLERDFSTETGELTLTLKLKRRVITERYRDMLLDMYRPEK